MTTAGAAAPGEESHDDLIQQLGIALLNLVPEQGWRRIDLFGSMTVPVQELALTVIMDDGSRPEIRPPHELNVVLAKLRALMYEPGRGAWFSARISMNPPGAIFYNCNFDHEPRLTPPISGENYAEDLKIFPREPEHIPDWLQERLAPASGEEQN